MTIKIITSLSPSVYDTVAFHPLQAYAWGEARKKMGIETVRLGEYGEKKLKNVFQMTVHKIPLIGKKVGYLPRSVYPSNTVLEFLNDWGEKNGLIFIKIEPYVEKFEIQNSKSETNFKLKISKHPLFPPWTQVLDIGKSEDELFKSLHPKTRYNIRLAQKKGVVVREKNDSSGFGEFSRLYFETCKRQKYFGHTPQYHRVVFDTLKNKIAHLLIAYYENKPLAAYEIFFFKNTAYYVYGGTSDIHRNLMASNLLMWEAIKLGRRQGAAKFDMWGSLPPDYDQSHPWSGFTRFKQGYGGKFVELIGSFDLVIDPYLYKIYNIVYKLREIFLKIKS